MRSKTVLYGLTLAIEIVLSLFRTIWAIVFFGIIFFILSAIGASIEGSSIGSWFSGDLADVALLMSIIFGSILGFYNIIASLLSYFGYGGGGTLTRFVLGAREPSSREWESIILAITDISSRASGDPKGFSDAYIIDSPFDQVNLVGTTLYLSSGVVQGENLRILLAHEIGHLNQGDGSLILALRRLVFPLFQVFIGGIRNFSTNSLNKTSAPKEFDAMEIYYFLINKILFFLLATLGGGLGVWLLSLPWANYFRNRDYIADKFVVEIGWKDQLIEYLEHDKFYDTSIPYMLGWQPANELRIDRLLQDPNDTVKIYRLDIIKALNRASK